MVAKVVISRFASVLREVELDKDRMTIGRRPTNDILLEDRSVSGSHAAIVKLDDGSFIEDLESRNGTLVNGKPVTRHTLKHGDVITVARYDIEYVCENESNVDAHQQSTAPAEAASAQKTGLQRSRATDADDDTDATTDFLEQLKKEADQREQSAQENEQAHRQQAEVVDKKVRPRMQTLYKYLSNLAAQLNRLKPNVVTAYDVEGYGNLSHLRQHGYRVSVENPGQVDEFTFSFVREGEGIREFKSTSRPHTQRQRDYLWSHNLRFKSKEDKKGRGTFYLEPRVPVSFEFVIDFERARVRLRTRNADLLGASNYSYEADSIDKEFMDELAKYILKKESRFGELSGNVISEKTRSRLRLQLEQFKKEHGHRA